MGSRPFKTLFGVMVVQVDESLVFLSSLGNPYSCHPMSFGNLYQSKGISPIDVDINSPATMSLMGNMRPIRTRGGDFLVMCAAPYGTSDWKDHGNLISDTLEHLHEFSIHLIHTTLTTSAFHFI